MTPSRRSTAVLGGAGALILAPFVWLVFFVAPQNDEFCYGAQLLARGWLGGIGYYATTLHGRYTTHVLIMLPTELHRTLGIGLFTALEAAALLLLAGLGLLCLGLLRLLLPTWRTWPRVALALLMTAALVANARSIRDLLYWWPASATYTVAALLIGAVYAGLLAAVLGNRPTGRWGAATIGLGLCLATWCIEYAAGMALAMLAGSWAARRFARHRAPQTALHLAWAGIVGLAFLALYLAPGNAARLGHPIMLSDVGTGLALAPIYYLEFLALDLLSPGLVGWLVLAALVAPRREPATPWAALLLPASLLGPGCLAVFVVGGAVYGGDVPARVQNTPYLLGAIAATSLALILRCRRPVSARWRNVATGLALLLVLLSPGFLVALPQLRDAPGYRAVYRARLAALEVARGQAVVLPALDVAPPFLHQFDIDYGGQPQCVAAYYGVASVDVAAPFTRVEGFAPYWFAWPWNWDSVIGRDGPRYDRNRAAPASANPG